MYNEKLKSSGCRILEIRAVTITPKRIKHHPEKLYAIGIN